MIDYKTIDWDELPDILSKEDMRKACHISKRTALFLLTSGMLPCEFTGKKTRCYKIKKEDLMQFILSGNNYKDQIPDGYYRVRHKKKTRKTDKYKSFIMRVNFDKFEKYLEKLLSPYPTLLSVKDIADITGYGRTAIINWCKQKKLFYVNKGSKFLIPKTPFIEFCCSDYFKYIKRPSQKYYELLKDYTEWVEY